MTLSSASDDRRDLLIEMTRETEPLTEHGEADNKRLADGGEQIGVEDSLEDPVSGGDFIEANRFE